MKLGIILPHELEDPAAVKDFVQAIDDMGFNHLVFPDHVVGANPASHELVGPYTHKSFFHELSVTMGYVAGLTNNIELVSGVMILPQRQTVLAAKQMAEVDILSKGRARVGVGVGWNQVEYQTLDANFRDRGNRMNEQIEVLRALWTDELVNFDGKWHQIVDAGINPRPVQRPIPVWIGGFSDAAVDRTARLSDGWLLYVGLNNGKTLMEKLHAKCEEVGRDIKEIGIQVLIYLNKTNMMKGTQQKPGAEEIRSPEQWAEDALAWKELGATHYDCWTMYSHLTKADQHIELARRFKETMDSCL